MSDTKQWDHSDLIERAGIDFNWRKGQSASSRHILTHRETIDSVAYSRRRFFGATRSRILKSVMRADVKNARLTLKRKRAEALKRERTDTADTEGGVKVVVKEEVDDDDNDDEEERTDVKAEEDEESESDVEETKKEEDDQDDEETANKLPEPSTTSLLDKEYEILSHQPKIDANMMKRLYRVWDEEDDTSITTNTT